VDVYNPAFDVTPARLIRALITEHGLIHEPSLAAVRAHVAAARGETPDPPDL
jgi:methylthioribose-1-phosphate isomerase